MAFQLLLLVGYVYAHGLLGLPRWWQLPIHAASCAAALLWLPLGLDATGAPHDDALVLWVPWRLIAAVGPLFVLLAAQAPLLQGWLRDSGGDEPYGLYRFSNIGSFLGLLAFPLIVEPLVPVSVQTLFWSGGFFLFAGLSLWLMLATRHQATKQPPISASMPNAAPTLPDWRTAMLWIALAAIPSTLILSTTTHITTDIVAMPLLWILPLALYLLSFIFAFSDRAPLLDRIAPYTAPIIAVLALIALSTDAFEVTITSSAALALLFIASLSLHRRLYLLRPDPSGLTAFYLLLALGGAIGGMSVAIVAPLVFDWTYEFPLWALAAVASVVGYTRHEAGLLQWGAAMVVTLMTSALAMGWLDSTALWIAALLVAMIWIVRRHRWLTILCLSAALIGLAVIDPLILSWNGLRQRSYFGIYTVRENETGTLRMLTHGTTLHGAQRLEPGKLLEPTIYFGRQSGAGQILGVAPLLYGDKARIDVLGLGVGTLACYAKPGQHWSFYEIDPLVIDLTVKQGWFTYMVNCAPNAAMHIGDARLALATQASAALDILVMDVFSSDSVPTHLLTREAFDIYDRVLAPRGMMLVHISNRYLNLEPVLSSEAKARGWSAALLKHHVTQAELDAGGKASVWVVMARSPRDLARALNTVHQPESERVDYWRPLTTQNDIARWTDDYSSVLRLIQRPTKTGD